MSTRNTIVAVFLFLTASLIPCVPAYAQGTPPEADGIGALSEEGPETRYDAALQPDEGAGLMYPSTVIRGDILAATLRVPGTASVQGEVELPDGSVHTAHGWRVGGGPGQLWLLLFGIPSTSPAGAGTIRVAVYPRVSTISGGGIGETRKFLGHFTVGPRDFISETIRLDGAMSDLRTEEDARKEEESRILWNLIHTTDLEGRYHRGRFISPLSTFRYTSRYGDRRLFAYADGDTGRGLHNGVDLAAPTGTPVAAAGRGRVVMATNRIVTGGTVVIEHLPAVYSLYYHLDSLDVHIGDIVEQGEHIGTVGSTGLSTGPHLHWEVRVSGVAVDPEQVIQAPRLDISVIRGSLLQSP